MQVHKLLKERIEAVAAAAVVVALIAGVSVVASRTDNGPQPRRVSCRQQVKLINYRSKLLEKYKESQQNDYTAYRTKWAERISYAGQWIPQQAQEARTELYRYDKLHADTTKEIDRQIKAYRYLEEKPLDCSAAKRAELVKKMDEVQGIKDGKAVGGNALIKQYEDKEKEFLDQLRETNGSLVSSLHKAKEKQPEPKHAKTPVKDGLF